MKKNSVLDFNIGNISIRVAMKGFGDIGDKTASTVHSHANFEYHTSLKGSAVLETEKRTVTLSENDSLIIFPDTFHKFIEQDKDSAVLSFSFSVKKGRSSCSADYYSLISEQLASNDGILIIEDNSTVSEYLKRIAANIYSSKPFAIEEMKALLTLIFTQLLSIFANIDKGGVTEAESPEYDTRVYIIEEYFNEHYMENISLRRLSERLYLGEKQTDRIIRRAFGLGFRDHLCKIRLKSAKALLEETELSVKEISERAGYSSYNGFYQAFKEKLGMSPNEYRAANK